MKSKINPFMCLVIMILLAIVIVPALIFTNSNKSAENAETPAPESKVQAASSEPAETPQETQTENTTETQPLTEESTETTSTETETDVKRITSSFKPEYLEKYSPNAEFYNERISIIGDSIAYGFSAYGYISDYNNLAMESVSIWNFDNFTIDKGAGEMSLTDAAVYVNPSLIYMSLGMNDISGGDTETFTKAYRQRVEQLLKGIPNVTIVVAGITPVTAECDYIDNSAIRNYNQALYEMVENINSPQVYFFDAYYALAEPDTLNLPSEISGDGIHIDYDSYNTILNALYNFLDDTSAMEQIKKCESAGKKVQYTAGTNENKHENDEDTDDNEDTEIYDEYYDDGGYYDDYYGYDYGYDDYGYDYGYYY